MKKILVAVAMLLVNVSTAQAATYTDLYKEFANTNAPGSTFVRNISVANTTSSDGVFHLSALGDFDYYKHEYVEVSIEGNYLGKFFGGTNQYVSEVSTPDIIIEESLLSAIISDGIFSISYTIGCLVNNLKHGEYLKASISFDENLSPVPVPAAAWLFGTALLGLVGIRRKKLKAA